MNLDVFDEYLEEVCHDCEKAKDSVELTNCPYAQEISGDLIPMFLCSECFKERAEAI